MDINCINTTIKLIRDSLLTETIFLINTDQFAIQDDILIYLDKIWVPEALRTGLIQEIHN